MLSTDFLTATPDYDAAKECGRWTLAETLLGGTQAMRAAGEDFLPRFPAETVEQWNYRLNRSYLHSGFEDAVDRISSKPFSEAVSLTGAVPDWARMIEKDADGRGTPLTEIAREVLRLMSTYGAGHVLVDNPRINTTQPVSVADEESGAVRPFFVVLRTQDAYWWQSARRGAHEHLTALRWKTAELTAKGERGKIVREWIAGQNGERGAVRVIDTSDNEIRVIDEAPQGFPEPFVPVASMFASRRSLFTGKSPLVKCADANLEHWQFASDHKNYSSYAMVPKLKRLGIAQEEKDAKVEMTAQSTLDSKSKDATIEWLAGPADILRYGAEERDRIQKRMELLGMAPFFEKVAITVPEALGAKQHSETQIKAWVRALEAMLRRCFEFAASWRNEKLPDDFAVNVFSDFEVAQGDAASAQIVLNLRMNGDLDAATTIDEMKRRGILSENVTAEDIATGMASDLPPASEDDDMDPSDNPAAKPDDAGNAAAAAGATLSGVQITAAKDVILSFYKNELTAIAAVTLLVAVGISRTEAQAMTAQKLDIAPELPLAAPPAVKKDEEEEDDDA